MKSIRKIITVLIVLTVTACSAQIKNAITDSVKVYGNCEMCESTIEKVGNVKETAQVDWDKDTKMATITYDASLTSKDEILKRIALAGYDSDNFLAPDDTYSNLPSCCQYERAEKMDESNMETKDHSMLSNNFTEIQDINPLSEVYDSYFAVKDALVKTDGVTASTSAKTLLSAINDVKWINFQWTFIWFG
jgi:copper chaperone CopZ